METNLLQSCISLHDACAALERLGKGGRRCCAGQREGESSFGADFGTVDQWMSIQSSGKCVDESASAEQVCIQSLFLMSASAPWGDSTLWSLMADKTQQTENKLRQYQIR